MRITIKNFLLLTVILFSSTALAGTVTTTADDGPGSLRAAISNAVPGEIIDFAVANTITLTSGELLINKSLTIAGPGAANLTIQRSTATGTPDFRIFNIQPGAVGGVISGVTISNGRAVSGAGINNDATFALRDCVISGNSAAAGGGGILNLSTLSMTNCVVRGNSVVAITGDATGGGLDNQGTMTNVVCLIISNSVSGGSGGGGLGGGVHNAATLELINSTVSGNSAIGGNLRGGEGGGIFNSGDALALVATTVALNSVGAGVGSSAQPVFGGGIAIRSGTVTLDRSTISGNLAAGGAGGVGGSASGGGIINDSGTLTVENSTISGNLATGGIGTNGMGSPFGGGLFNTSDGVLTLKHSTIVSNVSLGGLPREGGGLLNSGGVVIAHVRNTIVAGNTAASDLANTAPGEIRSGGFNLMGFANGPIPPGPSDQFNITAAQLRIGPLQDNGGPTFTHALLCGSPAINAGDNTDAPATDQRGFPRIVSGVIDIGSFEAENTAPTITCSGSITTNCAPPTGQPATVSVNVADADGDRLTVVWMVDGIRYQTNTVPAGGPPTTSRVDFTAIFGVGPHVISVSVTDPSDCTTNCTTTITVNADTTVPSINCLGNKTNECGVGSLIFDAPTVSDECGSVTISVLNTVTNLGCGNTFVATRTWVATDSAGNTNTCRQTIASIDTTAPILTCPSNLTVSCASQVPVPNTNSVTASDGCGGAVTVNWQADSISASNCVGQFVITRTYQATDQCSNSATCAQTITVQDTNPPSITCPSNLTVSCSSQVPLPNTNSVTANDGCGGAVTVSWQADSISASNCVGQFVITRTYRATDQCGNSATCAQTITVQDTNPPSITCPSNLTVSCSSQVPVPNTNSVTANDGCGGAVTVSWQADSISASNCVGQFVITRTYRATDQCGNSATCAQTITVQDTNPPSISCSGNKTNLCGVSGLAFDTPAASDGCGSATISILSTVTNLTSDGKFVATRNWVATDPCGNTNSCSQTIVAVNLNAPTITCVSPVIVNCASATGTVATVSVNVFDFDGDPLTVVWTVDGRPAQTNTVPAGSPPTTGHFDFAAVFTVGTHQISVTVSDTACEATCSTTVTINASAVGDLYPIALHIDSLTGVPVGGIIRDIYNGVQPGNFGWLTWAGSPNEPTIVTSLTPPGNSSTYINPRNRNDHTVSVGDWVQGKPGVTNSDKVRKALDTLKQIDIVVPVWDRAVGRGNNSLYQVVRFARVRITDYRLPKQNRITARFLGFVDCQ